MKSKAPKVDSRFDKILYPANSWYEKLIIWFKRNWIEILSTLILLVCTWVAYKHNPNKILRMIDWGYRATITISLSFSISVIIGAFLKYRVNKILTVFFLAGLNFLPLITDTDIFALCVGVGAVYLILRLIPNVKKTELIKYIFILRIPFIILILYLITTKYPDKTFDICMSPIYMPVVSFGFLLGFLTKETGYIMDTTVGPPIPEED
jgi:hypothetical protein